MISSKALKKGKEVTKTVKRGYELQRLHVYDQGGKNSLSGVKATVFGGTSPTGAVIGASLSLKGGVCVYPHRRMTDWSDHRFRELRVTADLGYKTAVKLSDFTDPEEVGITMRDSNVVVCCIGSKFYTQKGSDFEESNIKIPMAIAQAVKDSPNVKRFIYISAAGADPNSASARLRTKWLGEQEVREICPDVTVLRPTHIVNLLHPNLSVAGKWSQMMKMFNRTLYQIEGANAKVQPVFNNDIALAVQNCLKMDETIGKAYDLGGPHVYTYDEIYEMFFNQAEIKPYVIPVKLEDAFDYRYMKFYSSFYRILARYWLYPEMLLGESIDVTTSPDNLSFEDLYIKPVSFGHKSHEFVQEVSALWNDHTETKQNEANA